MSGEPIIGGDGEGILTGSTEAVSISPTKPRQGLRILMLNPDFPVFPGGIAIEFLNIRNLAAIADRVGLVSMIHTENALRSAELLSGDNLKIFAWQNPLLQDGRSPESPPKWKQRLHQLVAGAVSRLKAGPSRPIELVSSDLSFRNMAGPLTRALSEESWDAIVVIQSHMGAAVDYIPEQRTKVLVLHDIRSLLFERRARAAKDRRDRRRFRREAARYFRLEREFARRYDLIVVLSPDDAAWVNRHYNPRRVAVVPMPIDVSYFSPQSDYPEVDCRIVFTGLMNHPPNVDAAVYFARDVFPLIRTIVPRAEFLVVGKDPAREVLALDAIPGVTVTGPVPDTRPYLSTAAVVVVPLRFGSGVRTKILEAWAMQKYIVSTSIGAEGLQYTDGVDLAIADDAGSFATTVAHALKDRPLRDRIRNAGRRLAMTDHDPKKIAASYYQEIEHVVVQRSACEGPLRTVVDLNWMVPGLAGGIENLGRSLVRSLIDVDRWNSYTILLPAQCRYDFDLRRAQNIRMMCLDSVTRLAGDVLSRLLAAAHAWFALDWWQSPEVRSLRLARELDAEIAYSVSGYFHPVLTPLRKVLMVPDIQHEYFPNFFPPHTLEQRRSVYTQAIRSADHLCAISQFTRQTLIERFGISPDSIDTIYLAADPIFTHLGVESSDSAAIAKYGLEANKYLLFPGHTWKHKNHRAAISALRILETKYEVKTMLVCPGGSREAQPELRRQIEQEGLGDRVRFIGYCPQAALAALYRQAAALVFPSIFEGFGMPVLEAMASGCPVVCSNTTSLPEIAGDAALMMAPDDHEGLADRICWITRNPSLRDDLRARGIKRASCFSWKRHALETVAVLQKVRNTLSFQRAEE
jgi:glycosyltransferase involved in cell wall biosynthesis